MNTFLKKSFAVLLISFIFVINTIPVSFAQSINCSSIIRDIIETDAAYKARCENAGCQIITGSCSSKTSSYEVDSGAQDSTLKSTDLGEDQCKTIGYSISKDENCKTGETKIQCPEDSGNYRCVSNSQSLQPTQIKIKDTTTTYKAKVEIPCNTLVAGGDCPKDWQSSISSYILRLYQFGLMISGLVALGVIMYGAVLYTLSAGNVASKEEGKEWMKSAIYGVVLLFGAYLILYTINPNLVKIGNPEIEPVNLQLYEQLPIFVPDGPGNNQVATSTGASIPGCEIMSSGAMGLLDDFVSLDVNGEQVTSTGTAGTFQCQRCLPGNELKDGKCECSPQMFRRWTGVCCDGNQVLVKGVCTGCAYLQQFRKNDNYAKELSPEDKAEINKLCATDF